jgi:DNA-binding winged helix-turn-helix (wHTH) protein
MSSERVEFNREAGFMNSQGIPSVTQTTSQGGSHTSGSPRYVVFSQFCLDLERQELFNDGSRVKIQSKVCQVLMALLENPGKIVTREALRARLWSSDTHVNYEANLNTAVNKLRHALGDMNDPPTFIETSPRRGYSFIGKVEYQDQGIEREQTATPGANAPTAINSRPPVIARETETTPHTLRQARALFIAGLAAMFIAALLLGAAVTLYSYRRPPADPTPNAPVQGGMHFGMPFCK